MDTKHSATRISRRILQTTVAALLLGVAATAYAGHAREQAAPPEPSFDTNTYGNLEFPDQFPDGTSITITQWSHFVPRYDRWFEGYAADWGEAHNVDVTVNLINLSQLAPSLSSSIAAGQGATMFEMIAAPTAFIEGLQPLNEVNKAAQAAFGEIQGTCSHSSYLPSKDMWFGFCHGWVADPGDYRRSLWKQAGYPNGPENYEDLVKGGHEIFQKTGIPVAVGMSPELDSEFYARALIWSFGGRIQNENTEVVFNSPEVLAAVKYQKKLFEQALTPEVFAWNPASNNQTYIACRASYIQNSISFYRTAQEAAPEMAQDTGFRPGLKGPDGEVHMPAHVWFIYVVPEYVKDETKIAATQNFVLDLVNNYANATFYSKFYNFPAFTSQVPQLFGEKSWLDHDPWGSQPADKLSVLETAPQWTAWLGYPGYSNPAISEVYQTHLISTMMANVARGVMSPKQAVEKTTTQIKRIFQKWRDKGYLPPLQGGS